jgi:hypothetical protein
METKRLIKTAMMAILTAGFISCEKPAGPGGSATIKGRIFAHDFDNTQRYEISKGYAAGERVYIMFGNDNTVGDNVRTAADGSYEFRYLNKGSYKIFVNSLDTSIKYKGNKTFVPVFAEATITDRKQVVTIEDIIINK